MINSYALILACLFCVFSVASAEAREWRSWCGAEASSPLGWHFYCDRIEEERKTEAPDDEGAAGPKRRRAHPDDAQGARRCPRKGDPGTDSGERHGLPSPPAGGAAKRRRVLGRLPARGLVEPGTRLHAQAPGRRAREEALDRGTKSRARRRPRKGWGSATASSTWARSGVPAAAYSGPSFAPSRCATGSRCSPSR